MKLPSEILLYEFWQLHMLMFDLIDSFCYMIFKICGRVHDQLPLYDILDQFQKGHSHMAVVVKCKNDS